MKDDQLQERGKINIWNKYALLMEKPWFFVSMFNVQCSMFNVQCVYYSTRQFSMLYGVSLVHTVMSYNESHTNRKDSVRYRHEWK